MTLKIIFGLVDGTVFLAMKKIWNMTFGKRLNALLRDPSKKSFLMSQELQELKMNREQFCDSFKLRFGIEHPIWTRLGEKMANNTIWDIWNKNDEIFHNLTIHILFEIEEGIKQKTELSIISR